MLGAFVACPGADFNAQGQKPSLTRSASCAYSLTQATLIRGHASFGDTVQNTQHREGCGKEHRQDYKFGIDSSVNPSTLQHISSDWEPPSITHDCVKVNPAVLPQDNTKNKNKNDI